MVILEGPDGSGKTTLAKALAKDYDLEYMRYQGLSSTQGPKDAGIIEWWDEQIAEYRMDTVYDRCFYISEPIYQLATPGRPLIADPQVMMHGIQRLVNFSPLIIFCLPPWEVSIANVGQRERLAGVDDEALKKIWWAYFTAYTLWGEAIFHHVTHYNYTTDKESFIRDRVDKYLRR